MGLWWLMEDLRETGTIGIGGRAGSFICARFIILSGYHRGLDLFRAVIPVHTRGSRFPSPCVSAVWQPVYIGISYRP